MNKLSIPETIKNIEDFLIESKDYFKSCDNLEIVEYISSIQNHMYLFKERIQLCMLASAAMGDVAIPTVGAILDWEKDYKIPMLSSDEAFLDEEAKKKYKEVIDTEMVYNTIENEMFTLNKVIAEDI